MKVLVVGGGGREHALAWKIGRSDNVEKVICAPGNAGIKEDAECVPVKADDIEGLVKTAKDNEIDLVMVGPEDPLTNGITDRMEQEGIAVFGCSKKAAELEGSKVFAKELMKKYDIPTGDFQVFDDPEKARKYIDKTDGRVVLKADGLAAGKGVIVSATREEANSAISEIMDDKAFGAAGDRILVEERLYGEEASFLAFTDGETVLPMAGSQDHKAVYDGDKGPNTGGMGAYTPAPVLTEELYRDIMLDVMVPTVRAMADEGRPYKGVLYAGIMITKEGPKVLEFNARFGDPETQPLMFRMESDIAEYLMACAKQDGSLGGMSISWGGPTVCVVMAAGGYPKSYEKGKAISGLEMAAKLPFTKVFHAGTAEKDGKIVTAGGRVLGVTARGTTIKEAIANAYKAVDVISWENEYHRTDIGVKALGKAGK